eukprot:gb/GECG01005316.1/.p1 GENE.gb/GECG01005316.1/~~gb/GECG01005316.1/.p1  ORF type:complete len:176 (+),score=17.39 gb/GECG01005316.1/:1-528(+)
MFRSGRDTGLTPSEIQMRGESSGSSYCLSLPEVLYREDVLSDGSVSDSLEVRLVLSERCQSVFSECACPEDLVHVQLQRHLKRDSVEYFDNETEEVKIIQPLVKACAVEQVEREDGTVGKQLVVQIPWSGDSPRSEHTLPTSDEHANFPFQFLFNLGNVETVCSNPFQIRSRDTA